jgi:prepilin-type N-terminal cleavage/methylation domain-containing protein
MKRQAGFSLVELAVVIFIIGLIASMSFGAFKAQMINASIRVTKGNQDTIKDALVAYLGRNRRLPCPDTNFIVPDGIENRGATGTPAIPANPLLACNASIGLIPYTTLGLPRTVALDGWDNFYSYQISNIAPVLVPVPAIRNKDWTLTANFHEGNTGAITVTDGVTPLLGVVAVVISYGKNGQGAYTIKGTRNALPVVASQPYEDQNAQQTIAFTFFKREYTDNAFDAVTNPSGSFDDVVMVLGTNELLNPLIKDGVMQTALGVYSDQIKKIQDYLVSQIVVACAVPPTAITFDPPTAGGLPANLAVDPWGHTLNDAGSNFTYTQVASPMNTATPIVYRLNNAQPLLPLTYQSIARSGTNLISIYPYLGTKCP